MRQSKFGSPGRLLLALFTAPLGAWVTHTLLYAGSFAISRYAGGAFDPLHAVLDLNTVIASLSWAFFLFYLPSVFASAMLALPTHALLMTLNRYGCGSYAVAGVLAGLLIWGALAWFNAKICGDTSNPCLSDLSWVTALGRVLLWGVMPAMAAAAAFWAVVRPDRLATGASPGGPS